MVQDTGIKLLMGQRQKKKVLLTAQQATWASACFPLTPSSMQVKQRPVRVLYIQARFVGVHGEPGLSEQAVHKPALCPEERLFSSPPSRLFITNRMLWNGLGNDSQDFAFSIYSLRTGRYSQDPWWLPCPTLACSDHWLHIRYSKCFSYLISFNPHGNSVSQVALMPPAFDGWKHWHS